MIFYCDGVFYEPYAWKIYVDPGRKDWTFKLCLFHLKDHMEYNLCTVPDDTCLCYRDCCDIAREFDASLCAKIATGKITILTLSSIKAVLKFELEAFKKRKGKGWA